MPRFGLGRWHPMKRSLVYLELPPGLRWETLWAPLWAGTLIFHIDPGSPLSVLMPRCKMGEVLSLVQIPENGLETGWCREPYKEAPGWGVVSGTDHSRPSLQDLHFCSHRFFFAFRRLSGLSLLLLSVQTLPLSSNIIICLEWSGLSLPLPLYLQIKSYRGKFGMKTVFNNKHWIPSSRWF